ncbi:MAG: murein biosynthesis integral membrane protein MurJ [SAR324 cluster bacterium]|nr:murein biosynthesis integral membrane protein MurJ [SAR324 cluster bacterium]
MSDPVSPGPSSSPAAHSEEAAIIYRHAGIVTAFTLISRVLGMARDLTIAHRFGASGATDAWVQAFRIPNALRRLTAEGSMTIAFVPIFVQVREQQGPEAAIEFARRVLGLVLVTTLVLTLAGILLAGPLTALFSPGFLNDPEKFALTADLLRLTFPYLILVSLVAWAMGILNAQGSFAAPAAAPIFLNVGIIAAVIGFSGFLAQPVLAIAGGVLVGGVAQVLLQLPSLGSHRIPLLPKAGWSDPHVRQLFRLLLPSLFGVAVYELNIIILGVIASFLPAGQIFQYHNATRLSELAMGLFALAFTTAGLPQLSRHQAHQDWERLGQTIRLTFAAVLYTILPAMAGLIAAAPGIVAMLYLHGAFQYGDVVSTADAVRLLALGLPALAGVRVMVPVFYAMGDARTPVAVSAATLLVTGALGWWLSQRWEVQGLALGLSGGTWVQCALLGFLLRRKASHLSNWFPWRPLVVQGVSALACGLLAWWAIGFGEWRHGPFSLNNWIVFGLTLTGAAALYLAATLMLGDAQARNWVALAKRVLSRASNQSQDSSQP